MHPRVLIAYLSCFASAMLVGGEIADLHKRQQASAYGVSGPAIRQRGKGAAEKISEIGIARSGGPQPSREYDAVLFADGRLFWHGHKGVAQPGEKWGKIRPKTFQKLARLIAQAGIWDSPAEFLGDTPDAESIFVYMKEGKHGKVIRCHEAQMPILLWTVAELVDKALAETGWGKPMLPPQRKMRQIIIPEIQFEGVPISDAYQDLARLTVEYDPEGEGVLFRLKHLLAGEGEAEEPTVTMTVQNIAVLDAVEILNRMCGLACQIDAKSVTIVSDRSRRR